MRNSLNDAVKKKTNKMHNSCTFLLVVKINTMGIIQNMQLIHGALKEMKDSVYKCAKLDFLILGF